MIGQVGEALQKAGILTPALRLRKIVRAALDANQDPQRAIVESGDVEAALTLANPRDVALSLKKLIEELEQDGGRNDRTGTGLGGNTPVRSTEMRPVEGHGGHTGHGLAGLTPDRAQQDQDEAGQTGNTESGQAPVTRFRPGHAKQRSPEALAANAAVIAKSLLDSFAIIDRNGERLTLGDIYVSSYDRLIKMTAKRSWRASREHNLLVLLKAEVERKAAYIPADAKTRDIIDDKVAEHLVAMATATALPHGDADEAA